MADKSENRRRHIVDTSRMLILRRGLRGTTMEALAREAEVAKATLYAYFQDKDAVFAAVVDTLVDELNAAFEVSMASGGDLPERIGRALGSQFNVLANALAGSPYATELMSEHRRAGLQLREREHLTERLITEALDQAGANDAQLLSHIIISSAYGIALKTNEPDRRADAIMLVCRRVLAPALNKG
ncbi:TetR/AcrR family transcriptional regulator [Devosia sp. ZW T5_3]|uniref:TetR/AcrR family transcriptional regulator n=1 Tax=Devosia sp. ZW T5_3 TaxID=3378085 RepID=UPI00385529B2